MKTKKPITDIQVDISYLGYVSFPVSCNYDGARYHLWINAETLQPSDEVLYKNPPLGVAPDQRYAPRTLRQAAGVGKILVPAMLANLPELVASALQALQAKREEQQAQLREAERTHRIKEAGPKLLRIAKLFMENYDRNEADEWSEEFQEIGEAFRAVILEAEGGATC